MPLASVAIMAAVPIPIAVALTCRQLESEAESEYVYACGVALWELLVGRSFDGSQEMPLPTGVRSGCPAALDDIVIRAMSRDPRSRFATRGEMARTLALAVPPASADEVVWWAIER